MTKMGSCKKRCGSIIALTIWIDEFTKKKRDNLVLVMTGSQKKRSDTRLASSVWISPRRKKKLYNPFVTFAGSYMKSWSGQTPKGSPRIANTQGML